jgi:5-methylthioadenosine/S-adenosylhomocysteine deaminase
LKKFDLGVRASRFLGMAGGSGDVENDKFLGVKGGVITEVARWKPSFRAQCRQFLDGSGHALLPGFVNGHTHLPMSLFRGVAEDLSFHDWLFGRILPLEDALVSKAFVRDGIELALLECIRFGTTTVNEMYFYAGEEAAAIDRAGLRALVSQSVASLPLPEDRVLGKDKWGILDKLRARYLDHPRITIGLGPHAPYSCDDTLLTQVRDYAARTGAPVHIHLSETLREVEESKAQHGMSPVERLRRLGLLTKGTICAHCVHLSEADRVIFAGSGASMVHNPDSNAKLGAGVAPVTDYLAREITLGLGTDGSASNNDLSMLGAIDLSTKLQKLTGTSITAFSGANALRMATWGGARALGLGDITGSLELGKRADFILIDLRHPHLQPVHDLVNGLVFAANGSEVSATVCEGKVLYLNGKFTTLKPEKIYARAEFWRRKIHKLAPNRVDERWPRSDTNRLSGQLTAAPKPR